MNRARILRVGLLAISLLPLRVEAQTPGVTDLQTFTRSSWYRTYIAKVMSGVPEAVFKRCPTLVSNGSNVTPIKPVAFAASGFPNAGSWLQRFPVNGCGNDTTLNFIFTADPNEKINSIFMVPGGTRADLALQRDALRMAFMALAPKCGKSQVTNTRFEKFGWMNPSRPDPGPSQRFRPWTEIWTFAGCDQTIDLPMEFMPDGKGTQVVIAPRVSKQ